MGFSVLLSQRLGHVTLFCPPQSCHKFQSFQSVLLFSVFVSQLVKITGLNTMSLSKAWYNATASCAVPIYIGYSGVLEVMHFSVWHFDLQRSPILTPLFRPSWQVPSGQDGATCFSSQLPLLSCCCAAWFQLFQAVSFIKWVSLLLCFVEWDCSSII